MLPDFDDFERNNVMISVIFKENENIFDVNTKVFHIKKPNLKWISDILYELSEKLRNNFEVVYKQNDITNLKSFRLPLGKSSSM